MMTSLLEELRMRKRLMEPLFLLRDSLAPVSTVCVHIRANGSHLLLSGDVFGRVIMYDLSERKMLASKTFAEGILCDYVG